MKRASLDIFECPFIFAATEVGLWSDWETGENVFKMLLCVLVHTLCSTKMYQVQ